jgi:hypothetical protein
LTRVWLSPTCSNVTTPSFLTSPSIVFSDLLVGPLLGDLRRPLTALAADLGDPLNVRVVELLDGLDPVHELRKLLELRPLVVRLLHWNLNLDRVLNLGH